MGQTIAAQIETLRAKLRANELEENVLQGKTVYIKLLKNDRPFSAIFSNPLIIPSKNDIQ